VVVVKFLKSLNYIPAYLHWRCKFKVESGCTWRVSN